MNNLQGPSHFLALEQRKHSGDADGSSKVYGVTMAGGVHPSDGALLCALSHALIFSFKCSKMQKMHIASMCTGTVLSHTLSHICDQELGTTLVF